MKIDILGAESGAQDHIPQLFLSFPSPAPHLVSIGGWCPRRMIRVPCRPGPELHTLGVLLIFILNFNWILLMRFYVLLFSKPP